MTIVRVSTDHGDASWEAGRFTGPRDVVRPAVRAAQYGIEILIGEQFMVAGGHDAAGAAAALFAHNPARTNLLEAPEDVMLHVQSITGHGQPVAWIENPDPAEQ